MDNSSIVPLITLKEMMLWFVRRRRHFAVLGHSMEPLLKEGDYVFARKTKHGVKEGDVVVCRNPQSKSEFLVKSVKYVFPDGAVYLSGLNEEDSLDSRSLGTICADLVEGVVTSRVSSVYSSGALHG